jgi:hypothetical protein
LKLSQWCGNWSNKSLNMIIQFNQVRQATVGQIVGNNELKFIGRLAMSWQI